MIRSSENYNPNRDKYKVQKTRTLLNAIDFYKGRKMFLIAFENGIFPLPLQYPSGMDEWKEEWKKESSISLPSPFFQHEEWAKKERPKNALSELNKLIIKEENSINKE